MRIIVEQIKNKHNINLDASSAKRINGLIVKEYINEYCIAAGETNARYDRF